MILLIGVVATAVLTGCATRYSTLGDCTSTEGAACRPGLFGEGYYPRVAPARLTDSLNRINAGMRQVGDDVQNREYRRRMLQAYEYQAYKPNAVYVAPRAPERVMSRSPYDDP